MSPDVWLNMEYEISRTEVSIVQVSSQQYFQQDFSGKCSAWNDFRLSFPPPQEIGLSVLTGGGGGCGKSNMGKFISLRKA